MSEYPTDIKEAIEWLSEADKTEQELDRRYFTKIAERILELKDEEAYKYELSNISEIRAKLDYMELSNALDDAKRETCRRKNWLSWLCCCAQSGIEVE